MKTSSKLLCALIALFCLCGTFSPARAEVTLRFRYWGTPEELAIIAKTIARFEHDHPGVYVHPEPVTSSGDEYNQKLLLERAAGLVPDVIFAANSWVTLADEGILMPLDGFLAKDHSVNLKDYYPQDVGIYTTNGHIYAIPRDIAPIGLIYYNKTLFNQAHIPYPDGSWSWDYTPHPERGDKDFLTVAEKLTQPATDGHLEVFGYAAGDPTFTMYDLIDSSGASVANDVIHPTKVLYEDPRVIKAVQLEQDMMYKYDIAPTSAVLQGTGVGSASAHTLFSQGRLAMYLTGIWEVPQFRKEITSFDWDIAPFPMGPTGLRGVDTGFSGYGIGADSRHKELAWEFVKYLAGPIGLSNLASSGLAQPAMPALANSKLWLDGQRPKNRVLTCQEVAYVHYPEVSPFWEQLDNEVIQPKLQLVWSDTLTAKQAIDEFTPEAQKMLNDLNNPPYHPILNWWYAVGVMVLITLLIVYWVWRGAKEDSSGRMRLGSSSESRAGYLFITPWIVGSLIFLLVPMLISLVVSFCSWNMIDPARFVGLGNLADMTTDQLFWKSLVVTGVYTIVSVPLGVIGSLVLALLLNAKIKGQPLFRTMFYIPSIVSAVAASLIWMRIFDPEGGVLNEAITHLHLNNFFGALGLNDPGKPFVNWLGNEKTALGSLIVMSLWGVGGGMIIFLAGLQGIPQSYYEAADIDGANSWQKFCNVTIPLLTPTIFFSMIIGVIGSLQVFTQGFVMTNGGPNNQTLFYVLYLYQNAFEYLKTGYACSLAWVLFVIILIITLIQMKMSKWVYYEGADK